MLPKERALQAAQTAANRDGIAYAVLNLNRAGRPLYVVREALPVPDECEVSRVAPQPNEGT